MCTKEKKQYRGRSFILVMLIVAAICGLVAVDTSYGDMMMKEGQLCLQVRRVDEAHLLVGFLGKEWMVNTEHLKKEAQELQDKAKEELQGFAQKAQEFLAKSGIDVVQNDEMEEGEPEGIPVDFPTQTL